MFDAFRESVLIIDGKKCEILYMNKSARLVSHLPENQKHICHKTLLGRDERCSECVYFPNETTEKSLGEERSFEANTLSGHHVSIQERLVLFNGSVCVLAIASSLEEMDRKNKEIQEAVAAHELVSKISATFFAKPDVDEAQKDSLLKVKDFFKAQSAFMYRFVDDETLACVNETAGASSLRQGESISNPLIKTFHDSLSPNHPISIDTARFPSFLVKGEFKGTFLISPFYDGKILCGIIGVLNSGCEINENYLGYLSSFSTFISSLSEEARLRHDMSYDDKTGLVKPAVFATEVNQILSENKGKSFVMVLFDIVQFKAINSLYGLSFGDLFLKKIGQYIKDSPSRPLASSHIPHTDEFFLFFEDKGQDFKEKIGQAREIFSKGFPFEPQFAFGLYQFKNNGIENYDSISNKAFLALRKAKNPESAGFIAFFSEEDEDSIKRNQLISDDFESDLKEGRFRVYVQGKYDLSKKAFVGGEALVRLYKNNKLISPASFISVYEESGQIEKLDKYVLTKTVGWLADEIRKGHKVVPISTNFSRMDFYDRGLFASLKKIVDDASLPHDLIEFEITETSFMDNKEAITAFIAEAKSDGFKVLMDDFGSGYSSLNSLKELDVSILKIDYAFLGQGEEVRRNAILRFIVEMSRGLKMPVIFEGVEKQEDVDFLRSLGVELIQGWYFSKPLPKEDFVSLVN